jgi:hypothetical protein
MWIREILSDSLVSKKGIEELRRSLFFSRMRFPPRRGESAGSASAVSAETRHGMDQPVNPDTRFYPGLSCPEYSKFISHGKIDNVLRIAVATEIFATSSIGYVNGADRRKQGDAGTNSP